MNQLNQEMWIVKNYKWVCFLFACYFMEYVIAGILILNGMVAWKAILVTAVGMIGFVAASLICLFVLFSWAGASARDERDNDYPGEVFH